MIRTAVGTAGFLRRYDYRRYKLTIGYTLFYSLGLFAVSALIARFAAGSSHPLPAFIRTTVTGQLYIHNLIVFAAVAVALLINPRMVIFDEIPTNRWNLFYKSGIRAGQLIANKLLFCIGSVLRIYLISAAFSLVLGLLLHPESSSGAGGLVRLLLLGICMLLVLIMPGLFFGAFFYKRIMVRCVCLLSAAGVVGLLMLAGYFGAQDEASAAAAVRSLVHPAPTALSVIAAALLILCALGAWLIAGAKLRNYEVEELDDRELLRLGMTRDIVVYEQNGSSMAVAISGPELFGDGEPFAPDFGSDENT